MAARKSAPKPGSAMFGLRSAERYAKLKAGYPTKDPETGKVTVRKGPPSTKAKPKAKAKVSTMRNKQSSQDMNTIQDRQRTERKMGMKRGLYKGKR